MAATGLTCTMDGIAQWYVCVFLGSPAPGFLAGDIAVVARAAISCPEEPAAKGASQLIDVSRSIPAIKHLLTIPARFMKLQHQCPSCGMADLQVLHKMTLIDTYDSPEGELSRTNNYQRNYLLFKRILPAGTTSLVVSFLECQNCTFIFFSPRPDETDLEVKYRQIAATKETERREKAHELIDLRKRRATEIAARLRPHLRSPVRRALDIGGADGHCLAEFVGQSECAVLDFEERQMWPGTNRIGRTLADLGSDDQFDLILCNHTLEHVDDVNRFLEGLGSRLAPGGVLYIEVPLGCNGEIFRTKNLLTHLNFFSRDSLSHLLCRHGFSVERCEEGPVLSKKRYVEVVTAIARKTAGEPAASSPAPLQDAGGGWTIRRRWVRYQVLLSNVCLVLSQPLSYARAIWRVRGSRVR